MKSDNLVVKNLLKFISEIDKIFVKCFDINPSKKPRDLCDLFTKTIGSCISFASFIIVPVAFFLTAIFPPVILICFLFDLNFLLFFDTQAFTIIFPSILGFILYILYIFVITFFIIEWFDNGSIWYQIQNNNVIHFVAETKKSWKEKYCPIIEYDK